MACDADEAVLTTESMTTADYDAVVAAVQSSYTALSGTCDATDCPRADWAGCVLRLAGHDFMDFKDGEGGSDGCIDLKDPDNNGLVECLHEGEFGHSVEDSYKQFCGTISLADFIVIAAEAVMSITRQNVLDDDASRQAIDFRSRFRYGRTTAMTCEFAEGRLPNPENSCPAVEETFVTSMGLDWPQAAALMGVHTLGRAKVENSGYNGWWSDAQNSGKFNNDYYISILAKGWGPEVAVNGEPLKNQWKRIDAGEDEAGLGKEMMLNTDMCLAFKMDNAGAVEMDAATAAANQCTCTWLPRPVVLDAVTTYNDGEFCGSTANPGGFNQERALCCGPEFDRPQSASIDCGDPRQPLGSAAGAVQNFARNEGAWLTTFLNAWSTATTNGFSLKALESR